MNSNQLFRNHLKTLAFAMALGAGSVHAQAVLEVGGAGVIGDTVLTASGGNARVPDSGANWTAAGGFGLVYSTLTSPSVTVAASGPATLRFTHRYNFETGFDGGAVYVSINGGAFTPLAAAAFTANGPAGDLSGSTVFTGGVSVFSGQSDGFGTPAYVESVANLGTLTAGNTIAVRFRGGWDDAVAQIPAPNWEVTAVKITNSATADALDVVFVEDGKSGFTVASDPGLTGPWTYPTPTLRFELNAETGTADRFVPSAAPAVIDITGAKIQGVLLAGTLEVGDTFSLFNLAGGSTLTGAIGSITLPPLGTWNTANLATNGTITFAALPPTLTWNLATGGDWDTTTENWTKDGGTTTTTYADVTNVIFDKPEGGVINGVVGRSPFSTTVNSSGNYSLQIGATPGVPSILSGTLTKSGSGILQLGDTAWANTANAGTYRNDFTSVQINGGTVRYGSLGALGTGIVTMETGTTLIKIGQEGNGAGLAMANPFVLNGQVTLRTVFGGMKDQWFTGVFSGPGSLRITGERRAITLTGNSTFAGGVTMENYEGTGATAPYNLDIGHANALGTGVLTVKTVLNPLLTQIRGFGTTTALTADSGVTNDIVIDTGATFYVGRGQNLRLGGDISGAGGLFKRNTTTVFLDGANTYSGGTRIDGGTLTLAGSLADATMNLTGGTVDGSGTLTFNIDGTTADQIVMSAGTLTATEIKLAVNATGAGLTQPEYILVNATGGTFTGPFASITGAPGYELNYSTPNQVKLVAIGGASPFATWSGGASADADTNGDGVQNGVAWVLGAASPAVNAVGLLPTVDNSDPGFFIFNYRRSDIAAGDPKTAMKVQYSATLGSWLDATPGPDIVITPFNDFYGAGIDKVEVKIRRTLGPGGKLFARLLVTVTP